MGNLLVTFLDHCCRRCMNDSAQYSDLNRKEWGVGGNIAIDSLDIIGSLGSPSLNIRQYRKN